MRVPPLTSYIALTHRFSCKRHCSQFTEAKENPSITLRYARRCSGTLKYRFAAFAGLLTSSGLRSSFHLALWCLILIANNVSQREH